MLFLQALPRMMIPDRSFSNLNVCTLLYIVSTGSDFKTEILLMGNVMVALILYTSVSHLPLRGHFVFDLVCK